ncbi:fumarate hydratase C-terminal domain-containing protein [Paeniglutamicibacter kerguelensis]|uniref:Tartrate dehydratase beta subunit/fumarate hydratase class I family protein n=1 Tax=Paeniglutamicibacter kerguelensis TaxID=254788 RepID=A0ABS4XBJ0_9MICC|nr:tartrate dehydratase beta subunit/fumarate hydratase class I family protein [Paeniglutamicibacter kerguelensis]
MDGRSALSGTTIFARDIAHARRQDMVDRGEQLSDYFTDLPVY